MMMRRLDFLNRAVCICSFFVFFLFFFPASMSADKEVCCNFPLKCFSTYLLMFLRFLILVAVSHSSKKNKQINDGRELQTYDDVQVDFRIALSAYVRRAQPV